MITLHNIYSLTDFKRNTLVFVAKMKQSKAPIVLTVNGEAELVVQDAKAYQELLDRVCRAEEALRNFKLGVLQHED
jgi:PHD/YefM family antitoxin component YafN of YafNO toxin-antitoxin module